MLEAVGKLFVDDAVLADRVEDVVVGLGLREGERHHEVRAGPEEQLHRLLQVPLRQAVELRVRTELHAIDRAKVGEQLRVLAQPSETREHVLGVDREALALGPFRERLALDVVVLLELEVLHDRARLPLHPALVVALEEEAPAADDLRALEERSLVEDHDVEALGLQSLRELAHEVDLVVEELVGPHLGVEEEADALVGERTGQLARGGSALAVGSVDRARLKERLELGLFLEKVHLYTYLYMAGPVPARAGARLARTRYPSVPPRRASEHRSGCGMRPTTLRPSLQTPAMFARDPLGLVAAVAPPRSSV